MRWVRVILRVIAATFVALAVVVIGAGQMGLFSGDLPDDLGMRGGKLRAGDGRPNWVSSQVARDDSHFIEPMAFQSAPEAAWAALVKAAQDQPGARVVTQRPDYLYIQYRSRILGFIDDAEFALDAPGRVIHARAGARLGIRDFAVNRKRVEAIRSQFQAP